MLKLNLSAACETARIQRVSRGNGIPHVAVKCVDMWRNTGGEGDFLVYT
jgi:hypothetical protein